MPRSIERRNKQKHLSRSIEVEFNFRSRDFNVFENRSVPDIKYLSEMNKIYLVIIISDLCSLILNGFARKKTIEMLKRKEI